MYFAGSAVCLYACAHKNNAKNCIYYVHLSIYDESHNPNGMKLCEAKNTNANYIAKLLNKWDSFYVFG